MRFHVGPHLYSLSITAGPLIHEGERCDSVCIQGTREILIAESAPVRDRLRLLICELARAWIFHLGQPRTLQELLDRVATIVVAALNDLAMCGGELALLSLRAGESPEPAAARMGLSTNRECAECHGTIAGGSVAWRPLGPGVVELRAYCDFCGRTMIWQEGANARGLPSATVLKQPVYERGDVSGVALREHASI